MNRTYVVRLVLPDDFLALDAKTRELLQLLNLGGVVKTLRDDYEGMCIDILPPAQISSKEWADALVSDFENCGYNAVRAPKCSVESFQPAKTYQIGDEIRLPGNILAVITAKEP
jgi:hypothetical protein